MKKNFYILLAIAALTFHCGDAESENVDDGQTIIIDTMTFIPDELTASAGEVITVINDDDETHTITSESSEDAFDDSGDFDSGILTSGNVSSIVIPEDAVAGDTFFFYCDIHEDAMTTPNGIITIE